MKNNKLLTIVILVIDQDKKLFKLIDTLSNSSYKNIEIIIVDNSGELNVSELIKRKFPKINLFKMPRNVGIFGYNIGFTNSKGKYVVVLDDDCAIEKSTLEQIVEYFDRQKKEVGILTFNVCNPFTKRYEYSHYNLKSLIVSSFAGGACAFRRDIFEKIGYYDDSFFLWGHEDDLALRAMDKGYKIHFVKDIIIEHYNKDIKIRPKKLFLTFRNKAWLNIKHFSLWLWPLHILRDFSFIISPHKGNSYSKKVFYSFLGYIVGYLLFFIPLSKRKVVSFSVQKKFLKHYLLGRYEDKIKILEKI